MGILTFNETMVALKSGRSYTYNLINSGKLKVFKMGGHTMSTDAFVDEYITNCMRASGLVLDGSELASRAELASQAEAEAEAEAEPEHETQEAA